MLRRGSVGAEEFKRGLYQVKSVPSGTHESFDLAT
jgi:hypothetical protein